jgi:hypothetical protein
MRCNVALLLSAAALLVAGCNDLKQPGAWEPLFPNDGVPPDWTVHAWADLRNPGPTGTVWRVEQGVLIGGEPRGSWLMSEREYGDFELAYEFKLGERGNSGCALRSPLAGDPAFDALEFQMADLRYNPQATTNELTGALYRAVAPGEQVYRPTEWNDGLITCRGSHVIAVLNGVRILDVNLDAQIRPTKRHDGTDAPPLRDRPRRGHIGFQELSRGGSHVEIRNARIRVFDPNTQR